MNIRYGNIFIFLLVLAMIGTLVTGSNVNFFPFTYFMFLLFFLISADYFYIIFQYYKQKNINKSIKEYTKSSCENIFNSMIEN